MSVHLSAGANQRDLGAFNERAIIETIRLAGTLSRPEIAERTGLTQQSVSRILRALIDRGIAVEGEQTRTERVGKPRTQVRLRADAAHAVGVLVDPDVLVISLVDLTARERHEHTIELRGEISADELIDALAAGIQAVVEEADVPPETVLGVGLAVPGPVTADGTLLDLPLSQPWRNLPLRSMLAERLPWPVLLEKDGTAAAVGERWAGRSARAQDFGYIYFGTGLGLGVVLAGDAYRGISGNAGEFGQLCAVRTGNVDADGVPLLVRECNPPVALGEIAREKGYRGQARTYREFAGELAAGVPEVVAAAQQIADVIGAGAAVLVDVLDLGLIVIGGPAFLPELRQVVIDTVRRAVNASPTARKARSVEVHASLVTGEAGAIGAASSVFHASYAPSLQAGARDVA